MKKKLLALLLALTLTVSMTACGGGTEDSADNSGTTVEDQAPEEELNQETEEPDAPNGEEDAQAETGEDQTEEAAQETQAEKESAQTQPQSDNAAQKPQTETKPTGSQEKPASQPAEKPAEEPAKEPETPAQTTPETPEQTASVDLSAFYTTLSSGENWPGMSAVEGEVLSSFYPGLSDVATNQCVVNYTTISAAVGEIALVEVKNASDVQTVKDIFQARVDYQVGDEQNPGGAWYPANIEAWKNSSRIVSNGNYVMLVVLGEGVDDVVTSFNALFA